MKRIFYLIMIVFFLLLSFSFNNSVSAQGEFEVGFDIFGEIGDYIEFKMINEDEEMQMTGYLRGEVTHEERITVNAMSYDCIVMTMRGSGDMESFLGIKGTWTATGYIYADKVTEKVIKETSNLHMTMEYLGEKVKMTSESTSIHISSVSNWTGDADPGIDDTWRVHTIEDVTTKQTIESFAGKESSTDEEQISEIEVYEYLYDSTITTKLGRFECRVIKSYDEDESDYSDLDYSLEYTNKKNNMPVKQETYENGSLVSEMEAIAYKFDGESGGTEVIGPVNSKGDDDEKDMGMFGLGKVVGIDVFILIIIFIVLLIVLILAGVVIKRHKRSKRVSIQSTREPMARPEPYQEDSYYQEDHYRQPLPAQPQQQRQQQYQDQYHYSYQDRTYHQPAHPHTSPPPPAPHRRYNCPTCGGALEYIDQYGSWYCYYCRKYQ